MKLSILASVAGVAVADFAQMANDLKTYTNSSMDRTISQMDMDMLNHYGCWCFFESETGRGHPLDQLDGLCKRLRDGYLCAAMDAAAEGFECVAWEVVYNSATGAGLGGNMDITDIRSECDAQNPFDDSNKDTMACPNWACKIEGYFVQQVFLAFTHGALIDPALMERNGFNQHEECPITVGIKSEKECCNEHPLRFPFKTYGGNRDCCVDKTFNTQFLSCCGDGSVQTTC